MDISSLRERSASPFSVTELNNYIKTVFECDRILSAVTVRGEISNFVNHRSGHLYFSLKDEDGQIRAVMFRSRVSSLRFMPENGMKVTVHGSVAVYARDGSYQIYVNSMQPDGIGALYLAYEQLKRKLEGEGMFSEEHKKPLPRYPKKIGVITAPTGAAVRDIINVTGRRFPMADLYLYPALVQGEGAEADLIAGIDYFDKSGLADVVIIGRGGGSIEDLWAFNSEALARRIFAADVPIISAVGHETDFTICDFVADMRAPTPSAAAELAVPDRFELLRYVDYCIDRADTALVRRIERLKEKLSSLNERTLACGGENAFVDKCEHLERLFADLNNRMFSLIERKKAQFAYLSGKLDAMSPLSVLGRGYGIVAKAGKTVVGVSELTRGDMISVRLHDGELSATVDSVTDK